MAPLEALNVPDVVRLAQADRATAIAELRRALADDRLWRLGLFAMPVAAGLAADPEVAEILAEARGRIDALGLKPRLLLERPSEPGLRPALVVLHGARGSAELEMDAWRPAARLGYVVAAMQSAQPSASGLFCWDDRERTLAELTALAGQLPAHGRLVLAGFSQGAWLALNLALQGSLFPAAAVVMAAPFVGDLERLAPAARRLRIHLLAGTDDPLAESVPALAQRYDVQSIPLIGLFRNGRMERASLGLKPRQQLEAELGMLVIP